MSKIWCVPCHGTESAWRCTWHTWHICSLNVMSETGSCSRSSVLAQAQARGSTALGGRACSVEQTMALLGIFQMRCSWIWNVCIIPHSLPQNGSEPGIARVCSDQVWQGGPPSQGERCAGIFTACWRLNLRSAALGWMANSGEKFGEMYEFLNTFSMKVGVEEGGA